MEDEEKYQRELNIRKIVITSILAIFLIAIIVIFSLYIAEESFRKWVDVNVLRKDIASENVASIDLNVDKNNQIYCYNKYICILNEKNLKSQSLASDLTKAESALVTSQIEVEKNTDLNEIEAYAKQKLGMQKPDKSQTIYVDTSKTNNLVEIQNKSTFIQKIEKNISNFLDKLFK